MFVSIKKGIKSFEALVQDIDPNKSANETDTFDQWLEGNLSNVDEMTIYYIKL